MDLPLHAQVSKALGWSDIEEVKDGPWKGVNPNTKLKTELPRYDISWCAVGPLVNKYRLSVVWDDMQDCWVAKDEYHSISVDESPTGAISRLVVRMFEEGKIKAA